MFTIFKVFDILFINLCYTDGEMEAEWLISAGYPELTRPFEQVRKLSIIRNPEVDILILS